MLRALRPLGVFVLTLLTASLASAKPSEAARQVFLRGVQQMQDGECRLTPVRDVDLCKKAALSFRAALILDPQGLGALKNLARVQESLGRLRAARQALATLADLSAKDPDPARRLWAKLAEAGRQSLDQRIPRLIIDLPRSQNTERTYRVAIDDYSFHAELPGKPIELDAGTYQVSVSQSGHQVLGGTVTLREGETVRLVVASFSVHFPSKPLSASMSEKLDAGFFAQPVAPLALTAVGAASMVFGLGFGYVALERRNDGCHAESHACAPGVLERARSSAHASTVLSVAGGTLLASGLTWYMLQSKSVETLRVTLEPGATAAYLKLHGTVW